MSRIGTLGAALTLVIVVASALLRLATRLEGGEAVSALAPAVEQGARIAHRVAAMGVGVLAALAIVVAARARPVARRRLAAVAVIATATLVLAAAGRYAPGYRFEALTVLHVVGGTVLASAFWYLRVGERAGGGFAVLPWLALGLLLAQAALGAATGAAAMHGVRAFGPLHLWLGTIAALATFAAVTRHREAGLAALFAGVAVLAQYALGLASVGANRALALTLAHAAVSLVLALAMVSVAARATPAPALARGQLPSP